MSRRVTRSMRSTAVCCAEQWHAPENNKKKKIEDVKVTAKYIKKEKIDDYSALINEKMTESNVAENESQIRIVTIEGMQNNPYVLLPLEEYNKLVSESRHSERNSEMSYTLPSIVSAYSQQTQNESDSSTDTSIDSEPESQPRSSYYNRKRYIKRDSFPPKPNLIVNCTVNKTIVLTWDINLKKIHEKICSYEIFTYEENDIPVDASLWKKVGTVQALTLPMKFELVGFVGKKRYYFTVRAVDALNHIGPFSDPVCIVFEHEEKVCHNNSA